MIWKSKILYSKKLGTLVIQAKNEDMNAYRVDHLAIDFFKIQVDTENGFIHILIE